MLCVCVSHHFYCKHTNTQQTHTYNAKLWELGNGIHSIIWPFQANDTTTTSHTLTLTQKKSSGLHTKNEMTLHCLSPYRRRWTYIESIIMRAIECTADSICIPNISKMFIFSAHTILPAWFSCFVSCQTFLLASFCSIRALLPCRGCYHYFISHFLLFQFYFHSLTHTF